MRITKSGKRNKQDWDIKDHIAAVAAMQREPTQPPSKRRVSGIDAEQTDAELGPMFQMGKE